MSASVDISVIMPFMHTMLFGQLDTVHLTMPLMPNVHIMPFVSKIYNANYAHNAIFTSNPMPNTNTMPIYAAYLALNECIFGIGWLHIWD